MVSSGALKNLVCDTESYCKNISEVHNVSLIYEIFFQNRKKKLKIQTIPNYLLDYLPIF